MSGAGRYGAVPFLTRADVAEGYRRGGVGWVRRQARLREEGLRAGTLAGVDHRASLAKLRDALGST